MKSIRTITLVVCAVSFLLLLHAQTSILGSFNAVATPLQPAQADSIVSITAEVQGLERVLADQVPRSGTFWLVTAGPGGGVTAPLPCPPLDSSLPIYQIADGQFLVDATGGQVSLKAETTGKTVTVALEMQADAVVNLISRIQEAQFNREFAMAFGMEEEFDSSSGFSPMFASYDPDALYLEITNVASGLA